VELLDYDTYPGWPHYNLLTRFLPFTMLSTAGRDFDADNDGIADAHDNCPNAANENQLDGDQDGVGDACDLCPDTPAGAIVDKDGCSANADFDGDHDVDSADLAIFQACVGGPLLPLKPGCTLAPRPNGLIAADFDGDEDVDQEDFGIFQRCLGGVGKRPDPNCGG
jgi:hypothetical protein